MIYLEILISYHSKVPIYEQIVTQIKSKVLRGEVLSGEALPPIRLLAKELGVSIITVKKAYEVLQKEGIIVSLVGKGTIISEINSDSVKENFENELRNKMENLLKHSEDNGLSIEEIKMIIEDILKER